jgi:nucleoid-associated protein YgaU
VPSFTLYRGSLLALLIGTAIAAWLILQPSNSDSNTALKPIVLTPTAVARTGAGTPPAAQTLVPIQTLAPGTTPAVIATTPGVAATPPAATTPPAGTPAAGTTPTANATVRPATPAANTGTYTVVSGDTLSTICGQVKPASMSTPDCVDRIVALNSLRSANDISIGQVLTVPK